MNRIRILPLIAAALLAACNGLLGDPGDARVAYDADRRAYTRNDEIVTTLFNASDQDVGYNLCGSPLEKQVGGAWVRVARNPENPCIQPLYILRPGQTATYREPANHVPAPGTYRLRTRVETPVPGDWIEVTTRPFTVLE